MGYYSPFQRDMDSRKRKELERPSAMSTLVWILIWAILIAIFV